MLLHTDKESVDWFCSTYVSYMGLKQKITISYFKDDDQMKELVKFNISAMNAKSAITVAQFLFENVGEEWVLRLVNNRIKNSNTELTYDHAMWIAHAFSYKLNEDWLAIIKPAKQLLDVPAMYHISG